jgi:uncharacterized damage-inducible protein DinB
MAFTDALLPEFDHEMGTTRRALERVPDAHLGWKPHDRSMSFGRLATHLAEIPQWADVILNKDEMDMSGPYTPRVEPSAAAIVDLFDQGVAKCRATLAAKTDAELMAPWTFKVAGKPVFTLPRVAVMRSMLFNHMVHHRGQLSVYLRLRDVAVPAMYGPSADEGRV